MIKSFQKRRSKLKNEMDYLEELFENPDLIKQELSRRHFIDYVAYIDPKFIFGWWNTLLCNRLQKFYDDLIAGEKPVLLIQAPPQHGKEIAVDTRVLTTKGWKNHGDLKVGDFVFHPSGKPIKVLNYIPQPEPCTLEVTLSNNEKIKVHPNHEWTVTSHDWKGYKVLETKEILKSGLFNGEKGKRGSRYKYQLPLVDCLEINAKELPIDPYFFGVWLGDGGHSGAFIYEGSDDFEVSQSLSKTYTPSHKSIHKETLVKKHYYSGHGITKKLKELNVLYNKHIPVNYILSSKTQRLELLAGLIDTDGSLHNKTGQYRFINTNKALIDGFCDLISSLGYGFSITCAKEKRTDRSIKDIQDCYQVGFTPLDQIPCRIKRKQSLKKPLRRKVSIVDIQPCSPVQGNCITVDSHDGLYLVGKKLIPTHNSHIIVLFISWVAGKNPDLRKIYASFSERLGIRANLKLQKIYDSSRYKSIFPFTEINQTNAVTISGQYLRNREILEYVGHDGYFRNTTTGGSITGESLDFGIIDDPLKGREAANSDAIRDKIWDWLLDDFFSRFSENGGLLGITTRWHIDDPFGRLIDVSDEMPELQNVDIFSYPAIAEEDEEHRKKGDALFPELKSRDFLLARKALMTLSSWASLYQQRPFLQGGGLFAIENFKIVQFVPELINNPIRYWDKAGTEDGGAYTAGVKMQKTKDGQFIVLDVIRKQMSPMVREKRILQSAIDDGKSCKVWIEQEPGSAGKESAESTIRNLAGYTVEADKVTGSKEDRAEPYAAQLEGGNILLLKADWNKDFIGEHELFPSGKYKDQVDAAAGAFNKLCASPLIGFTEKQKSSINKRERPDRKGKQW